MTTETSKLKMLIENALSVLPHELGCDECFEYFASYAESKLKGTEPPPTHLLVAEHLERCPFCLEEFNLLLEALKVQVGPTP